MTLHIIKILYHHQMLFIPYLFGNFPESNSGVFFPTNTGEKKFLAFACIEKARKSILSNKYDLDKELETFISIDNFISWLDGEVVIAQSLDEFMGFNSFILDFLMFFFSTAPNRLQHTDSDEFTRLLSIYMGNRKCCDVRDVDKYISGQLFKEATEKELRDNEVQSLMNSSNVKKRAKALLYLFENDITIDRLSRGHPFDVPCQ
jgi:hypothetical protein